MSVTIGSGVTYIGSYAFSCGIKLSTVNVNMNIPNVKGWKKFANIQETEFTGVETIKQKSTPTSYYSVSGEKLNNVHRGVNIIRMSDGTTRKVVVK